MPSRQRLLGGTAGAGLALGLVLTGCGGNSNAPDGGDNPVDDSGAPAVFVSQITDFDGFCNWSSAPAMAPGDAGDGVHGLGPLTVYWKKAPPHDASEFPVGTIIVKESQAADAGARVAFAMVRRASPAVYNAAGGGWEWWSLHDTGNCAFTELWRGPVSQGSDSYVGTPAGDCNGCHSRTTNDFVWDTALQLSKF
jgi:hypothetical protein